MSPLERTLYDLKARADADPYYDDIGLYVMRPRFNPDGTVKSSASFAEIDTTINNALNGLIRKNGKGGAAVAFLMPIGDTEKPNVPGPQLRFVYTARVQEIVPINMGSNGTGKSAEEIALHTLQLYHLCSLNGAQTLFADPATLTPSDQFKPRLTYDVRFAQQGNLAKPVKCARPIVTPDAGAAPQSVAITCATPSAEIYYTLDGSYPSSTNGTLYVSPIAIAAACTLRAAAEIADSQQSDVAQGYFS